MSRKLQTDNNESYNNSRIEHDKNVLGVQRTHSFNKSVNHPLTGEKLGSGMQQSSFHYPDRN